MSHEFYDYTSLRQGSLEMISLIEDLYSDNDPNRLISPPVQPGFLRNKLSQCPPQEGCSISQLIKDTKQFIYPGIMLWQSPRFFGYFPSTIAVTNILAEMFATTFHSPAFYYAMSPSHTELQNITVDWSAIALGLPKKFLIQNSGGGIINTSTTQSVLVSIHAAKHRKMEQINIQQNPEKIIKFVGYYGQFSFMGNERGLKMKQIFHRRSVPVKYCSKTQNLILDVEQFEQIVKNDVDNGLIPFWYGATYGTTWTVANDVNQAVLRVCKKYGMWVNVDAAYLASSWICPEFRPDMGLFEQVDSITLNFSKSLFLGNGGSLLYISDKKQLAKSMGADTTFSILKNKYSGLDNVVDYKDWMFGLNRRNNSIKFYYLFRHYGLEKLRNYIRQTRGKADHLAKRIEKSEYFKLYSKPEFGLVCFQMIDCKGEKSSALTKELSQEIKNIKQGFMSPSAFKSEFILRLAIGNNNSTIEIIDKYYNVIEEKAKQILAKDKTQEKSE